jgi:hypothetical protein
MEAVHRYQGTVNQVIGDDIMALFGAPVAHEDHAVRASYAGEIAAARSQRWRSSSCRNEFQGATPLCPSCASPVAERLDRPASRSWRWVSEPVHSGAPRSRSFRAASAARRSSSTCS